MTVTNLSNLSTTRNISTDLHRKCDGELGNFKHVSKTKLVRDVNGAGATWIRSGLESIDLQWQIKNWLSLRMNVRVQIYKSTGAFGEDSEVTERHWVALFGTRLERVACSRPWNWDSESKETAKMRHFQYGSKKIKFKNTDAGD
jgi:hypothetical protein